MADPDIAVQIERVSFSRGRSQILRSVSFKVEEGKVFGLIGRSGCGKSTTLRLVSGLIRPDKGSVSVFGRPAHEYAAENRCVATVWQDRALFPHLSVRGNLEFALRVHKFEGRKIDGKEREKRVKRVADDLRLTDLLDRSILTLSGGEQQRVALARAMLIEPKILLLDEPFTGLDQELKWELQADLRELVRDYRFTYLLVSHLQEDVFSLSDRVAVLEAGEIVQEGTRAELYERPANAFIAKFVGGNNVIRATVRTVNSSAGLVQVEVGGESGLWQARHLPGVRENDVICYVIGPQHVTLGESGACSVEASFWASTLKRSKALPVSVSAWMT